MNQTPKIFPELGGRSLSRPLLIVATVSALLAFLSSVYGCLQLLSPSFRAGLINNMIADGILQASAQRTWFLVDCGLRALQVLLAGGLMTVCGSVLISLLTSPKDKLSLGELSVLAWGARILKVVECFIGAVLAILFLRRVILYGIACYDVRGGGYSFFTMLVVEIVCMLALLGTGIWWGRFMSETVDVCASLRRVFLSQTPAGRAITPYFNRSVLTMSILWLVICLFRIPDWVGAVAAAFLFVSLFSAHYLLRRLKEDMEWMEYIKNKEKF